MKSLGYLSAFLGGAIAGAALGILVAPEKGQDTRIKITDAVEDLGAVNRVVEKDYDRMTPLIILTVSVTAAGAFIGFLAFTVVNRLKAKKKSNNSPGE